MQTATPWLTERHGYDASCGGVHGERALHAGEAAELRQERAEPVVVEGARGQRDAVELGLRGGDDLRMPVSLVEGRVGAQAVEVLLAVHKSEAKRS